MGTNPTPDATLESAHELLAPLLEHVYMTPGEPIELLSPDAEEQRSLRLLMGTLLRLGECDRRRRERLERRRADPGSR